MQVEKIQSKQHLEYDDALEYFANLLQGMKTGTIVVEHGENFVSFDAGKCVTLSIKAKQKKGKQKLSLELEWEDGCCTPVKLSNAQPKTEKNTQSAKAPAPKKDEAPEAAPQKAPSKKASSKKVAKATQKSEAQ